MKNLKKDQKTFIYLILFILIVTVLSSCGQKYVAHNINNNVKVIILADDDAYQSDDTVYVSVVTGFIYPKVQADSINADKYIIIKKY